MDLSLIDTDRLLELVKERPEIYDTTSKEYHNVDTIREQWEVISTEMNVPVQDCKAKWHSLRSSYARYLREMNLPSGVGRPKRSKWYYADDMKFVEPYIGVGPKRKFRTIRSSQSSTLTLKKVESIKKSPMNINEESNIWDPLGEESNNFHSNENRNVETPVAEEVNLNTESVSEFLKLLSQARTESNEDPMVQFIKGILPDINKLDERRKRKFKVSLLGVLNELIDEQEDGIETLQQSKTYSHLNMCSLMP